MSLPTSTKQFELASRPEGWPTLENFRLAEAPLAELGEGQVLVKNHAISVDPYMRGRMNDVKSYVPPFQLDQPLEGGAVGEVISSRAEGLIAGDIVVHGLGWREYAVLDAGSVKKVDASLAPETAFLGALGMTGLTAYAGLVKVADFKAGDVVFVSGAAGAVGSLVGQIAKAMGASWVIGSAGSAEKVAKLLELGFDAAFNYHDGPVKDQLGAALAEAPAGTTGIDVYFDNVGGEHLEAAISTLNPFGRVALCGAISQYNSTEAPTAPRNLALAIGKQLTLRGFIVGSYAQYADEYAALIAPWLADGKIRYEETVVHGIENTAQAFIDMLGGANTGKMVITLD
ncbi:NADP-dependent oxidoreductase [Psychromicrobium lacuslunae]|uniref:NADP-dependent oxidoreductase n=1 Tax=Psychromicrobium lacuslunae TaxID=1618207 RepID=A0A0D4BW77_9MICC|nr:NADP-dependent oxidoreductase [Psychromicrobium lacuslunae]AJT40381.1 NADP-dependent oxidoreductase [Psychromicrobium lacuslunae]